MAALDLVRDGFRAWLTPVQGTSWPAMADRADALIVTFVTGFGASAAAVPAQLRTAIVLLADHWFHRRETADDKPVPPSVADLVGQFRTGFVAA